MIPFSSILVMCLDLIMAIAIPVALCLVLKKKMGFRMNPVLLGAATFAVMVLVLETIAHKIILTGTGDFGTSIMSSVIKYALYGGIMAGLFEETGRYFTMKWLLKKEPTNSGTDIAYGIGHGGMEMMVLLASAMATNIVFSIMLNHGDAQTIIASAPEAAQAKYQAVFTQLLTTSTGTLFIPLWERISAIILQISLSVIMWVAVRNGGKGLLLFLLAFVLHASVDAIAVIVNSKYGVINTEIVISIIALSIAVISITIKHNSKLEGEVD